MPFAEIKYSEVLCYGIMTLTNSYFALAFEASGVVMRYLI